MMLFFRSVLSGILDVSDLQGVEKTGCEKETKEVRPMGGPQNDGGISAWFFRPWALASDAAEERH